MGEEPHRTQPPSPGHTAPEGTRSSQPTSRDETRNQPGHADDLTDLALVTRAKAGEHEAFTLLIQRYGKAVLNIINKMLQDRSLAEDLWQETFARAVENIENYEPRSGGSGIGFASWLYRIATNLTLDELRRRGRWRMFSWDSLKPRHADEPDNDEPYEPPDHHPEAPELLETKEEIQQVRRALERVPKEWRIMLILREYQDLPYEEIATILDIPLGTVRSRLARAREHFRKALLQESR